MIRELFLSDFSLSSCVWQSTIFLVVGLVGSFILRHRSARAHQVLFLAMMAAVIVPIMSILVKHYELGMFVAEPVVIQSPAKDLAGGSYGAPGIISAENIEHKPGLVEKNLPPAMAVSEIAEFPWRSVVLYGWIAASLILATRLIVTFVLGVRLLGRALPLKCGRIEEAVHLARAKLGIDKDVKVRSSRGVRSPVIWCWRRRPILLVPSAAGRFDNGVDWAGVLCHELAHWKRRDHISGLLAELVACILPWHPLLWWAKSRLVRLSEQACDDWVVATGQPGTDYAESLLDLTPGGQMAFVPAVVSTKRGLAGRVRRILKDSCGNPRAGAIWALAVSIVALCLVIGVACAQTRPAKPEAATEHETKPTKSLHHAVDDGDIEQVKKFIAAGADVNARDNQSLTPLHFAAKGGHEEIARLLIAEGANVNVKMVDDSWTPLLTAAKNGHTKLVKLLLEKGAKVDVGDDYGYTPLYYSIWSDDEESVRMLIAAGADVNRRVNEKDEYNAFFEAVWMGDAGIVKALIDADANVNYKDKGGRTPLHDVIEAADADVAKLFVGTGVNISAFYNAVLEGNLAKVTQLVESGTDVNTKDEFGWTPSYWALSAGQKKVFAYLLSQGADVTAKTNDGCTLLHQACKAGFTEIVKQLISKGVEVDAKPDSGNTPLKIAAGDGHEEIVKLLISKGADVNATSYNGGHPLGDAAFAGHEDVVKLLIASGAEVNLSAKINSLEYRGTALHAAARIGHSTILDLLIANGGDVNLNARNGTPLHRAAACLSKVKDEKCAEIVEKLLAQGADVNAKEPRQGRTPLHNTALGGRCKAAELLIAAGADVSAKDKEGHTPLWYAKDKYTMDEDDTRIVELLRRHGAIESLHDAAAGGDISQVKRLISKGADVNAKSNGRLLTPMYVAAGKGHKEICELLITKGAEVNIKSGELDVGNMKDAGWTPLHAACAKGHQGVAKLLLAHGAVVNAKTKKSKTPFDMAKKNGHREVVELLQKHGAKEGISLQDRFENAKLISSGTWLEGSFQYKTDEQWFAIDVEQNKSYLIYYDDEFGTGKYLADIETYLYKHIVDGFESKHCLFTDRHNVYHQPIKFISDYNGKLYLRLISDNPQNTTFAIKYETEE